MSVKCSVKNMDFQTLEKACTGVGIKYIHILQLGIESEQRQRFKITKRLWNSFWVIWKIYLKVKNDYLICPRELIDTEKRVALTCFEESQTMPEEESDDAPLPDITYTLKHL